jgi:hypothetical protein
MMQHEPYLETYVRARIVGFRSSRPFELLRCVRRAPGVELVAEYYVRRLRASGLIKADFVARGRPLRYYLTPAGELALSYSLHKLMPCLCCGKRFHVGRRDFTLCANCLYHRCADGRQRCKENLS